jgi:hypothetical protein
MLQRTRKFLAGLVPSALAGASFVATVAVMVEPGGSALGGLVVGGIAGVAVVGMIRLFRIAPWGYWVAGLVCGPVPLLVVFQPAGEDRFGVWLFGAIFGLLIGLLEWARVRRPESDADA